MDSVSLAQYVSEFYESVIFGRKFDIESLPAAAALLITDMKQKLTEQLKTQLPTSVPCDHSLVNTCNHIEQDLQHFLTLIKTKNHAFLVESSKMDDTADDTIPSFQTTTIQNFYHQLSQICNGSLDKGLLSNRFVYNTLCSAYNMDEFKDSVPIIQQFINKTNDDQNAILKDLIKGKISGPIQFKDAQFWGNVARNLIEKKESEISWLGISRLQGIQQLYHFKCQSHGKIIDPYTLRLDFLESSHVDPTHWTSGDFLLAFTKHEPLHALSRSIKDICKRLLLAIFHADETQFPFKEVFSENDQSWLLQFILNIQMIHHVIPQVSSKTPLLKLVDIFHRLMALTKYDKLWIQNPTSSSTTTFVGEDYFHLYLHLLSMKHEVVTLRRKLMLLKPQMQTLDLLETTRTPLRVEWTLDEGNW